MVSKLVFILTYDTYDKMASDMIIKIRPTKVYEIDMTECLKQLVLDNTKEKTDIFIEAVRESPRNGLLKIYKPPRALWNYMKSRIKLRADYIHINDLWEAEHGNWGSEDNENSIACDFIENLQVELNAFLEQKDYADRDRHRCTRHLTAERYDTLVRQYVKWYNLINAD